MISMLRVFALTCVVATCSFAKKKDKKLVNAVIKTYPNVSQFWTYNPDEFLKKPVYNRDTYPENKYLEP